MTAGWWGHLAEMLDEAAEHLADQERSTADYLARAAWMVQAISEEEAAGELRCRRGGSGSGEEARAVAGDAGVASGDGTNPAGGHGRPAEGAVAATATDGCSNGCLPRQPTSSLWRCQAPWLSLLGLAGFGIGPRLAFSMR